MGNSQDTQQPLKGGQALHRGDPDVSCHPCTEDGGTISILQLSPAPCDKTPGELAGKGPKAKEGRNPCRHSWKSVMEQSQIQQPRAEPGAGIARSRAKGRARLWSLKGWSPQPELLSCPRS